MPARNKSAPLSRDLPGFGKYYTANNNLPGAIPSVRIFIKNVYISPLNLKIYLFVRKGTLINTYILLS
jgi:hypothetical protein